MFLAPNGKSTLYYFDLAHETYSFLDIISAFISPKCIVKARISLALSGCEYSRYVNKLMSRDMVNKRAYSVKVWCTKIAGILRIVFQAGAKMALWWGN